jgi:hypothetical protein
LDSTAALISANKKGARSKPAFTVYEEPNLDQPTMKHQRARDTVFSTWNEKEEDEGTDLCLVALFEPADLVKRSLCCKDEVNQGTKEFRDIRFNEGMRDDAGNNTIESRKAESLEMQNKLFEKKEAKFSSRPVSGTEAGDLFKREPDGFCRHISAREAGDFFKRKHDSSSLISATVAGDFFKREPDGFCRHISAREAGDFFKREHDVSSSLISATVAGDFFKREPDGFCRHISAREAGDFFKREHDVSSSLISATVAGDFFKREPDGFCRHISAREAGDFFKREHDGFCRHISATEAGDFFKMEHDIFCRPISNPEAGDLCILATASFPSPIAPPLPTVIPSQLNNRNIIRRRSGWPKQNGKLLAGSPMHSSNSALKDPYQFVESSDVLLPFESLKANTKLCENILLEVFANVVKKVSDEHELDQIFHHVLDEDSSTEELTTDEIKLKRIFDSVLDDDDDYETTKTKKKAKKSLDEIFNEVLEGKTIETTASIDWLNLEQLMCSQNCKTHMCDKIPSQVVQSIKTKLSAMRVSEFHNFLLERLCMQKELGLVNSETTFTLEKYDFCHRSFQMYFGISDYLLKTVVSEHKKGQTKFIHGNQGNLYSSPRRDAAIAFIHHIAEVHSENLPDRSCLQLPNYLDIKTLFEIYLERTEQHKERVGEREFYLIFNMYFGDSSRLIDSLPRIVFQPYHTHPVCNICCRINDLRKRVKHEADAKYAETRKRMHMLEIRRKYLKFTNRRELPLRYPEDYLHIGLDDMDQAKLQSPYFCQKTKELSNLLKLKNHLTGAIITNGDLPNDRVYKVFVNNDQYEQGSNKTISLLFNILIYVQNKLGKLPRKLMVQSDNCGKDLKNQYVLAFYYLLVEMDVFDEVLVSHMPPGHTHNDVDWCFGLIAQKLKKVNIPTFEALKKELSKVVINSQNIEVEEVTHTTNFKKFIENGHLLEIQGHRSFSQFKIRKENLKTKMYVKVDELAENFTFSAGIKLLKDLPKSIKFEISPFRRDTGYSEVFESVFTKYIPSLDSKYTEEEVVTIKSEWETRITFLIELKEADFTPFDLRVLKKQPPSAPNKDLAEAIVRVPSTSKTVTMSATFYPMELSSFSVLDLKQDVSLVFYSETKKWRPWIGLFDRLSEDQCSVTIQWLKKEKQNYVLHKKADGSPYLSSVAVESIMFSDVLENLSLNNDREGPYVMQNFVKSEITNAYKERDLNIV